MLSILLFTTSKAAKGWYYDEHEDPKPGDPFAADGFGYEKDGMGCIGFGCAAAKSKARGGGRAAAAPPPEATRLPPTTWTHPLADLSDGLKRQNDEFLAEMKAAAQLGLPPAL